jgi:hypothetical protein
MTGREMLLLACIPALASAASPCEGVAELRLPNTMITAAERVAAGAMAELFSPGGGALSPAACAVPCEGGDPKSPLIAFTFPKWKGGIIFATMSS